MKPKQMMLFAVAIGCGLVAMFGAQHILSGNRAPDQEMIPILVAKDGIEPGVRLDNTNVEFKPWPKNSIPDGAVTKEEEYADRPLTRRVSPHMPILLPELGAKGAFGINSMIPKGMEVVSLPVDGTMTHSGLLRPGSFVKISIAIDRLARGGKTAFDVKTVLERVKVLVVGDKIGGTEVASKDPSSLEVKTISFLVFPVQAQLLQLAKAVTNGNTARLQIALLGEVDKSAAVNQDLDESALGQKAFELFGDKSTEILGVPSPTAKSEPATRPRSTFAEYVKQQGVNPEVAELGKGPTKATWKIVIYNKDKAEIQELPLPDDQVHVELNPAPANLDWTAPLMQFFGNRKRMTKPTAQETRIETRSDDARPTYSNGKSAKAPGDSVRQ